MFGRIQHGGATNPFPRDMDTDNMLRMKSTNWWRMRIVCIVIVMIV